MALSSADRQLLHRSGQATPATKRDVPIGPVSGGLTGEMPSPSLVGFGPGLILGSDFALTASLANLGNISFSLSAGSYFFELFGTFDSSLTSTIGFSAAFTGTQSAFRQQTLISTLAFQSNATPGVALSTSVAATSGRGCMLTGMLTVTVAGVLTFQASSSTGVSNMKSGAYARVSPATVV